MKHGWLRRLLWAILAVALVPVSATTALLCGFVPADWGATAVIHPWRRPLAGEPALAHEAVRFENDGVRLEGWLFRPAVEPRATVVYLHGIADNRQSGVGLASRLVPQGYAVFTYDARAHGRSGGDACSYGYHERHDVRRALDAVPAGRAILIGHSLGAAVALQAAAVDRRVVAVVAAAPFSDLRSIVEERARWVLLPPVYVSSALARAGELGRFPPADASPLAAAARVRVPVLLLHGAADRKTPPHHSERIAAALAGPHRLVLLEGVGHDEILGRDEAWREIEAFLDQLAAPR